MMNVKHINQHIHRDELLVEVSDRIVDRIVVSDIPYTIQALVPYTIYCHVKISGQSGIYGPKSNPHNSTEFSRHAN